MNWQTVELNDVRPALWKNGGGTTQELAAWPSAEDWVWRMSVAQVSQSGPFSRFEGVDRWFAVLEGDGVALSISGKQHGLTTASAPFFFDGGAACGCELLGGSTRDFNLMTRQSHASSNLSRIAGRCTRMLNASETIAIYSTNTGAIVQFDSQTNHTHPHSLIWRVVDQSALLTVESDNALLIRIALVAGRKAPP
jgi:uncharacterized protein